MLEKNSQITLTQEDLDLYNQGSVSDRLQQLWSLSFDELRDLIKNNQYSVQGRTND
jgi:hypothetical protein